MFDPSVPVGTLPSDTVDSTASKTVSQTYESLKAIASNSYGATTTTNDVTSVNSKSTTYSDNYTTNSKDVTLHDSKQNSPNKLTQTDNTHHNTSGSSSDQTTIIGQVITDPFGATSSDWTSTRVLSLGSVLDLGGTSTYADKTSVGGLTQDMSVTTTSSENVTRNYLNTIVQHYVHGFDWNWSFDLRDDGSNLENYSYAVHVVSSDHTDDESQPRSKNIFEIERDDSQSTTGTYSMTGYATQHQDSKGGNSSYALENLSDVSSGTNTWDDSESGEVDQETGGGDTAVYTTKGVSTDSDQGSGKWSRSTIGSIETFTNGTKHTNVTSTSSESSDGETFESDFDSKTGLGITTVKAANGDVLSTNDIDEKSSASATTSTKYSTTASSVSHIIDGYWDTTSSSSLKQDGTLSSVSSSDGTSTLVANLGAENTSTTISSADSNDSKDGEFHALTKTSGTLTKGPSAFDTVTENKTSSSTYTETGTFTSKGNTSTDYNRRISPDYVECLSPRLLLLTVSGLPTQMGKDLDRESAGADLKVSPVCWTTGLKT